MRNVIELEKTTEIPRDNPRIMSYIACYPHILNFFARKGPLTDSDVVIGTHVVYGWMPRVLTLRFSGQTLAKAAEKAAEVLEAARQGMVLRDDKLALLRDLINNSLVGTSKLLHFLAPDTYAIWDKKVSVFVCGKDKSKSIKEYQNYLKELRSISHQEGFSEFHASVNRKLGYEVSALRAIELVMYLVMYLDSR